MRVCIYICMYSTYTYTHFPKKTHTQCMPIYIQRFWSAYIHTWWSTYIIHVHKHMYLQLLARQKNFLFYPSSSVPVYTKINLYSCKKKPRNPKLIMCSWNICIFIYICIHTYVYIYIYIYTKINLYSCKKKSLNPKLIMYSWNICIFIYICIHTYVYIYIYIYTKINLYSCKKNLIHWSCTVETKFTWFIHVHVHLCIQKELYKHEKRPTLETYKL